MIGGISTHTRTVIVTGASRGLGMKIALRFGIAGCKVIVNYLDHDQAAASVVNEIKRAGGEAIAFRADIRSRKQVSELIQAAEQRWGSLDVLVNNAGVISDALLLRMTEKAWDTVIDANLKGPFLFMQAALPIMSRQLSGHIINISSIVGVQGREGQANYAASKAGLIGLTKCCAREMGHLNIKVNAVLPGYLSAGMGESLATQIHDRILKENALNRISDPNEVADFIFHLSCMNNVSGQVFNLDSRTL